MIRLMTSRWNACLLAAFGLFLPGCPRKAAEPAPANRPAQSASIGSATMKEDGTIVLQLRAEGPGALGDSMLIYPPNDPDYAKILQHIGPMRPGETKNVAPWPEK